MISNFSKRNHSLCYSVHPFFTELQCSTIPSAQSFFTDLYCSTILVNLVISSAIMLSMCGLILMATMTIIAEMNLEWYICP
jgi:hypothetical protein